jgi:hypothetical protein
MRVDLGAKTIHRYCSATLRPFAGAGSGKPSAPTTHPNNLSADDLSTMLRLTYCARPNARWRRAAGLSRLAPAGANSRCLIADLGKPHAKIKFLEINAPTSALQDNDMLRE